MSESAQAAVPLRWAPRVERLKIRRLYESDAAGRLDEDLLEDVGVGIWARCDSIVKATDAHRGRLACPACGAVIEDTERLRFKRRSLPAVCVCGWSTAWGDVLASMKGKELVGGAAEPYFREYLAAYPKARSTRQKLILIDRLIHEFHSGDRFGDVRPAAVNVIEGRLRAIMQLLDELAGAGSTPGQAAWRRRAPESVFGRHLAGRGAQAATADPSDGA